MPLKIDQYDPNAVEDTPKSSLVTRKDFKRTAVVVVILALLFFPIYKKMMDDRDKHLCKRNLGDISQAMLVYAASNSDRYPPIYNQKADGTAELSDGKAYSWISNLSLYAKEPLSVFKCPACSDDETTQNEGVSGKSLEGSYGMFGALSARPLSDVANLQTAVVVSETSNLGAQKSYDPHPLAGMDGFVIGFDKTNFLPSESRGLLGDSVKVTRLAFRETDAGIVGEKGSDGKFHERLGRHQGGNHFIFADGHIETRGARMMELQRFAKTITGNWTLP